MTEWITGVVNDLGYAGIAFLMLLENVFPPIPSKLVMPLAGFAAAETRLTFAGVFVAGLLGSLASTVGWYWVGRAYGMDRLRRFAGNGGQWIGLSERDLDRAMGWFHRRGRAAVLIG